MCVALRKESVDRNTTIRSITDAQSVALRKESVDRNTLPGGEPAIIDIVALRKESVDRNAAGRKSAAAPLSRSPQGERG